MHDADLPDFSDEPAPDSSGPFDDDDVVALAEAADVARYSERQWGDALSGTGVVHATAVWRRDPETHVTLRVGPEAPAARHDTLALGLLRARADAILTTGRILRAEPEATHALPGPGPLRAALAAWRREILGKVRAPVSLVLTSGRDVDFDHPFFRAGVGRKVVFTSRAGAFALESRAIDFGVEVVAVEEPTPRAALEFLRAAFGAATIAVEAGPSVARGLYEQPLVIDEVMLSIFAGPDPPTRARGARQPPPAELRRLFPRRSRPFRVASEDGPWEFVRYSR